MSNDQTDEITTEFFENATGFNIGQGRFRTVAGNSYTGCDPSQLKLEKKAPPPTKSKNSYFKGASNFGIFKGEFDTVRGDAVDFPGHHSNDTGVPPEKTSSFTFSKPRGSAHQDSVPVKKGEDDPLKVQTTVQVASDGKSPSEDGVSSPDSA